MKDTDIVSESVPVVPKNLKGIHAVEYLEGELPPGFLLDQTPKSVTQNEDTGTGTDWGWYGVRIAAAVLLLLAVIAGPLTYFKYFEEDEPPIAKSDGITSSDYPSQRQRPMYPPSAIPPNPELAPIPTDRGPFIPFNSWDPVLEDIAKNPIPMSSARHKRPESTEIMVPVGSVGPVTYKEECWISKFGVLLELGHYDEDGDGSPETIYASYTAPPDANPARGDCESNLVFAVN